MTTNIRRKLREANQQSYSFPCKDIILLCVKYNILNRAILTKNEEQFNYPNNINLSQAILKQNILFITTFKLTPKSSQMKRKFQIKPEDYGFPSKIGGMTIKTITWKDFPAKPPENTWFLAYTYWNTNWTSTVKNNKGTVLPTVSIGPKAWTRAHQDFKLLEHQTGHYWIACHCALEFMKRINYTQKQPEDMKFGDWAQSIWKTTASQFAKEQKRYDKETYHYLIEDEQARWMKEMIQKFNDYHKFFEERKAEDQKKQTLVRAQLNQMVVNNNNTRNGKRGTLNSVPINKKLPSINSKPTIKQTSTNQIPVKRPQNSFSVKKTNNIFSQNSANLGGRNVTNFERAKNTILGNIQLLDDLK